MKWLRHEKGSTGCDEWWELVNDKGAGIAEIMFCTPEMALRNPRIPEGWVYVIIQTDAPQWQIFPDSCGTHEERIAWVTTEVRLS